MNGINACDTHDYFEGSRCPICGAAGDRVLSGDRRRRLSTFLSGLLRHFPDDHGLDLTAHGWAGFDRVVTVLAERYDWADAVAVAAVVATDPKGRFERTDGRIRAAYGHSVEVTLDETASPVPDSLYHGTAPSNLEAILAEGLEPMERQLVHLSGTVSEARAVGRRHASEPVLLEIAADRMLADGYRIAKRGNTVYTTDRVPPRYVQRRG